MDRMMHSSKEAEAELLNQIRSDINFIGKQVGELETEQASLTPEEQAALAKARPLLQDAAVNAEREALIRIWRENQISDDVLHEFEEELDYKESNL